MSPLEDAATPGRAGADRPGARERIATRLAFFIAGFAVSAWAPLIPFAKRRLALDDAQLGLMLLCLGIGSVLMMPLAGGLAARFGCRRTILAAGTVICLCLPALMLAPSIPVLAAALAVFGASLGVLDVVMNLQAVIVERASGRAMMSGFHGMYSVGGIAGAGGVAGALTWGASPLVAITGTAVLAALLLAAARGGLLAQGGEGDHPAFALPRGRVLLVGAVCFAMFLSEGAVLDWSAVFLSTVRHADPATAGFGYVAFAATMTLGRLTGDSKLQMDGKLNEVKGKALDAYGRVIDGLDGIADKAPVDIREPAKRGLEFARNKPLLTTGILAGAAILGLQGKKSLEQGVPPTPERAQASIKADVAAVKEGLQS